jgi:hypothetical protein
LIGLCGAGKLESAALDAKIKTMSSDHKAVNLVQRFIDFRRMLTEIDVLQGEYRRSIEQALLGLSEKRVVCTVK